MDGCSPSFEFQVLSSYVLEGTPYDSYSTVTVKVHERVGQTGAQYKTRQDETVPWKTIPFQNLSRLIDTENHCSINHVRLVSSVCTVNLCQI